MTMKRETFLKAEDDLKRDSHLIENGFVSPYPETFRFVVFWLHFRTICHGPKYYK